ncbi:hypothetical protein FB446DRAFT_707699 [Lentinula raphanica]|nr:hypothetical protein FB446DRAFT_707699 [Lentinula raphanica]
MLLPRTITFLFLAAAGATVVLAAPVPVDEASNIDHAGISHDFQGFMVSVESAQKSTSRLTGRKGRSTNIGGPDWPAVRGAVQEELRHISPRNSQGPVLNRLSTGKIEGGDLRIAFGFTAEELEKESEKILEKIQKAALSESPTSSTNVYIDARISFFEACTKASTVDVEPVTRTKMTFRTV